MVDCLSCLVPYSVCKTVHAYIIMQILVRVMRYVKLATFLCESRNEGCGIVVVQSAVQSVTFYPLHWHQQCQARRRGAVLCEL